MTNRGDDEAGLANLHVVGAEAAVDSRARGADCVRKNKSELCDGEERGLQ